jgi:hypothetical protein
MNTIFLFGLNPFFLAFANASAIANTPVVPDPSSSAP